MTLAQHWPGKSDAEGTTHAAIWHMLDVAAVALVLIPTGPLRQLSAIQREAITFLIALHDLGKISASFLAQIVEGRSPDDIARHWRLSEFLLYHHDVLIAALVGGSIEVREVFYVAVAGHHGRPPISNPMIQRKQRLAIGPKVLEDSGRAISALGGIFGPMSLDGIDEATARQLSWLVSGLTVQADWVGSNTG